jgi:dTDP-4-dehydrorhamnose reductase
MKIVLLGSSGQLGQAVQKLFASSAFPIGWQLIALERTKADLSKPESLLPVLNQLKPDAIINAAAYTQVDLAEKEKEICDIINAESPKVIARYCADQKIALIHFSTDYVYKGDGTKPHEETEILSPQSTYGKSKARGDEEIAKSGCDYLIFRTSWIYSQTGKNFVKTMLRLGKEKPELKVVEDQIGSPTYAPDLAEYAVTAFMKALEAKASSLKFPSGVYHLANAGQTSWYEFAKAIIPGTKVLGIPSSEYPTPAKRPLNSRLNLEKFKNTFAISPRPWQDALRDCLKLLG